jgi:hypothetical protein
MPKKFYTEQDVENLYASGVRSLQVDENVVLTELAYEKAKRLGMQLLTTTPDNPPSAPVRPYLSQQAALRSAPKPAPVVPTSSHPAPSRPAQGDLANRIRAAVNSRLGNQIDPALLDKIIERVLKSTGVK